MSMFSSMAKFYRKPIKAEINGEKKQATINACIGLATGYLFCKIRAKPCYGRIERNRMKENIKFVIWVMVIHVLTYLLCGVVFSALFDYTALYQQENINTFMRAVGSASLSNRPCNASCEGDCFLV